MERQMKRGITETQSKELNMVAYYYATNSSALHIHYMQPKTVISLQKHTKCGLMYKYIYMTSEIGLF